MNTGPYVVENTDGAFVASFATKFLADCFVEDGSGCYRHRLAADQAARTTTTEGAAAKVREAERICRDSADRASHQLDRDLSWRPTRAHYEGLRNALRNAEATLATPPVTPAGGGETLTADLLGEVMQDAWGEICDDAGAHPSDIEHGRGKVLFYRPSHWTRLIALRLKERLSPSPAAAPAREAGAMIFRDADRTQRFDVGFDVSHNAGVIDLPSKRRVTAVLGYDPDGGVQYRVSLPDGADRGMAYDCELDFWPGDGAAFPIISPRAALDLPAQATEVGHG